MKMLQNLPFSSIFALVQVSAQSPESKIIIFFGSVLFYDRLQCQEDPGLKGGLSGTPGSGLFFIYVFFMLTNYFQTFAPSFWF